MLFDSKEQQATILKCIHVTAASLPKDASDMHLANLATLVKLRHEVEAGIVAGVAEPASGSAGVSGGAPQPSGERG
jgi:hypothetical protein